MRLDPKPKPLILNPQPSTFNPQPSTLNPNPYVGFRYACALSPQNIPNPVFSGHLNPKPYTLNPQPQT
mgnify:CR=1 FL=1|jgi:hypothetical protein